MVNWKSKRLGDLLLLANGVVAILLFNLLSSHFFFRIDLTEENRYTIKTPTREMLSQLDDDVYVEVFLEGDLNAGFTRFQKAIRETLEEFRIYSGNKVRYTFTNPTSALSQKAQSEFARELASKGIQMLPVIENKDGERIEKIVFPGALISYGGIETGVMLFKGNRAQNPQEVLNQSIEGLEYELANAIYKVSDENRKQVAILKGHAELDSLSTASFESALAEQYDVIHLDLTSQEKIPAVDLAVLAKPTRPFSEMDKFKIDQYLMDGGRLLLFVDRLDAVMDSASSDNYFASPYDLDLDDLLFKYGLRINPDLIQDRAAGKYPVVTGVVDGKPQMMLMDWPFFPLINQYADHPVARNMDATLSRFVSSVDTIKVSGVKKTALLFSSPASRKVSAPVKVGANDLRRNVNPESFNQGPVPVAYLLEGTFTSLYKNRFLPEGAAQNNFKDRSVPTKMIVVADGDFVRNDVNPRNGQPQQLGLDPFTGYTFSNQDLVLNMIAYLSDENGLINARNKEVKIRPLDRQKVNEEKTYWQMINLILPLSLIVAFGIGRAYFRKLKYTRFG